MAQLGSGNGSGYPSTIDTRQVWENAPVAAPDSTRRLDAEGFNDFATSIVAIETTLGANPQGVFGSVGARLNEFLGGSGGSVGVFTFTDVQRVTVPGTVHNVGQGALLFKLYDAQIPAAAMAVGSYSLTANQHTYDVDLQFAVGISGALALGATSPLHIVPFTNVSTVSIPGNVHTLGTADLLFQVYNDADPAEAQPVGSMTIDPTTFDVQILFGVPLSGFVVLSAGGPTYAVDFTATQVVNIPGSVHLLGTRGILFQVYDNGSPRHAMIDPPTTVHPNTFDVVMNFGVPLSGRIVLMPATTLTGRDFDIRDAGVVGTSATRMQSQSGNLRLSAGGGNGIYFQDKAQIVKAVFDALQGFLGIGVSVPTHQLHLSTGDAVKAGGGPWLAPSSAELKEQVRPFTDGLALILQLAPILYRYNGSGGMRRDGLDYVGLMAEAAQDLSPLLIRRRPGRKVGRVQEPDVLAVDTNPILYMLINAAQELHALFQALREQLGPLLEHVARLEARVTALEPAPPDDAPGPSWSPIQEQAETTPTEGDSA